MSEACTAVIVTKDTHGVYKFFSPTVVGTVEGRRIAGARLRFLPPLCQNLFVGRQSSYKEVGTLTHLFTRIRSKRSPQSDDTELARTNRMRLVNIARLQQVLELLMRSVERFASSSFDQEVEHSLQQPSLPAAALQLWSRHQARSTEPLANAFECSILLAGAGAEELAAARRGGTDLALAMQARKELDTSLKEENGASPDDFRSLPAIINQRNERREQLDVAGEVNSVIRELADGVLGYAADCEMSDDLAAFQDIAASMRGP